MYKSTKFLFLLIFLVLVITLVLEVTVSSLFRINLIGEGGGKINYYLNKLDKKELVILGNSRAKRNIIPELISENSYSLTHNGMMLSFHYGLLNLMASKNRLPDTIIWHLDPFEMYRADVSVHIQHLKMYYHEDEIISKEIRNLSKYEFLKHLSPIYRYNGKVISTIVNGAKTLILGSHDKGYSLLPTTTGINDRLRNENRDDNRLTYQIQPEYFRILSNAIELCKEKRVTVLFYTAPLYFDLLDHEVNASKSLSKYLAERNQFYFDYLVELKKEDLQRDEVWYDEWHFNELGAVLFTREFKDQIQVP